MGREVSETHNLTTFLDFTLVSTSLTLAFRNLSEPQTKHNRAASSQSHPRHAAPRSWTRPQRKRPALGPAPSRSKPQGRGLRRPLVHSSSPARRSGSDVTVADGPSLRLCGKTSLRRGASSWRCGTAARGLPSAVGFRPSGAWQPPAPFTQSHGRSGWAGSSWTMSPSQPSFASAHRRPCSRLERPW